MELIPSDIATPFWANGYYPEDMPAEWQLAYYANEFRRLYVPAELGEWLAGQESASFETLYLEDERALTSSLEVEEVVVLQQAHTLALPGSVEAMVDWGIDAATTLLFRLKSDIRPTLRELRLMIERLDQSFPDRDQVIIADAEPKWIGQGRTLLDLMGK